MNAFELDIKNNGNHDKPAYYLILKIDGDEFLKKIDADFNVLFFEALRKSVQKSGEFLIFTCYCGIADCGGWDYVKVRHEAEKISWDFNYGEKFHFEFPKDQYKTEIARIEFESKNRKLILEPTHVMGPE